MRTIPNQRRARPCLQLWHLAGAAPTLVAALALPGTAKAAVDLTVAQRAEPTRPSCATLRLEDLDSLVELGCVPAMSLGKAEEAAEFALPERPAARLQPEAEAMDAAARCAVWTTVPDLDADATIPSYCTAPAQTVLAAPSSVAPVVQPADKTRLEDAPLAGDFYAVDDFYAQSGLEESEEADASYGAAALDSAPGSSSTQIADGDHVVDSTETSDGAAILEGPQSPDQAKSFDGPGTPLAALSPDNSAVESVAHSSGVDLIESAMSRIQGSAIKTGAAELDSATEQRIPAKAAVVRNEATTQPVVAEPKSAEPQVDFGLAVKATHSEESLVNPSHKALTLSESTSHPGPQLQATVGCGDDRDVELDSAMPTYCIAATQTVIAARSVNSAFADSAFSETADHTVQALAAEAEQACTAISGDFADSAMPVYCTAPSQVVLAARSQAGKAHVVPGHADRVAENSPAAESLPESLLGAKMVASEQLSETRGGFETTDRGQTLRITFGIERAVYVNGALVSTSTLALGGLAGMTNVGAGAQGANVRAVSSTADVVRNGADNVLSVAARDMPAGALVVQNSLSNQRLDANTVVNAVVEASGLLRATRLEAAMREATTGALRR